MKNYKQNLYLYTPSKGSLRYVKRRESFYFLAIILEFTAFLFTALIFIGLAIGFVLLHPVGGFH